MSRSEVGLFRKDLTMSKIDGGNLETIQDQGSERARKINIFVFGDNNRRINSQALP